jgi:methionine aminopeptidase
MSIKNAFELAALQQAGKVVKETLAVLEPAVKPGMTTRELEDTA